MLKIIWVMEDLIKEDLSKFLSFVIDHKGGLYYAKSNAGQIIRVDT